MLKCLSSGSRVSVTTHDLELQRLLEDYFAVYHFSEQVESDRFFFDCKIREGPCSSGKAIKLLNSMGYPADVVAEAGSIAEN
jgi:DNA mismatch repair ATPase MutS